MLHKIAGSTGDKSSVLQIRHLQHLTAHLGDIIVEAAGIGLFGLNFSAGLVVFPKVQAARTPL